MDEGFLGVLPPGLLHAVINCVEFIDLHVLVELGKRMGTFAAVLRQVMISRTELSLGN